MKNIILQTVITQFTAKTINSEKAIYFLSLMSCSIKKLKFHTFFTCNSFIFSDCSWKKSLLSEMVGVGGGGRRGAEEAGTLPAPLFHTALQNLFSSGNFSVSYG